MHEFRCAADFKAAKGPLRLEDRQGALRAAGQMTQLDVAFGDYHLERVVVPAKPHRRGEGARVLAVGGQYRWGGRFEQRARVLEPGRSHGAQG